MNQVLFAGVGDAYRVKNLVSKSDAKASPIHIRIGALVADKGIETGTLILIGLMAAFFFSSPVEIIPSGKMLLIGAASAFVLFGVSYIPLRPVQVLRETALNSLNVIWHLPPKTILIGFGLSVFAWVLEWFALMAVTHPIGISASDGVLLLLAVNLGSALPSPPLKIGVYEAVMTAALSKIGIPITSASEIAVVAHVTFLTALGCAWLISRLLSKPVEVSA